MTNIYRKAIYDSCALTGLPVYDYWITGIEFPYIVISAIEVDEYDYKLNTRQDFSFTIDLFDKKKGKTAAVNYANQIVSSLKGLDGVSVNFTTRHMSDIEPNVIHTILVMTITKYTNREVI